MKDIEPSGIDLQDLESLLGKTENKKTVEELIAPYIIHWKWILLSIVIT